MPNKPQNDSTDYLKLLEEMPEKLFYGLPYSWTFCVGFFLYQHGPTSPGDLYRDIKNISRKAVYDSLNRMLEYGCVKKTVLKSTIPARVVYELTDFGMKHRIMAEQILMWTVENSEEYLRNMQKYKKQKEAKKKG